MPLRSTLLASETKIDVALTFGLRLLAVLVVGLCLKGVWDVTQTSVFPSWFPPAFGIGVAGILVLTVHAAFASSTVPIKPTRGVTMAAWGLLAFSFLCTTSLHSFFPFRVDVQDAWGDWPTLRLNLLLAAGGFLATAILTIVYARGSRDAACLFLVCLTPLLLLPNDDCLNPFNRWWIEHLGASPLMYVPNAIAVIIAVRILRGMGSRLQLVALAGVCLAALLLGISHRTGIVW